MRVVSFNGLFFIFIVHLLVMSILPQRGYSLGQDSIGGHRILKVFSEENPGVWALYSESFFEDQHGHVWVGSNNMLAKYDRVLNKWQTLEVKAGQSSYSPITFIGLSADNKLWLASGYLTTNGLNLTCFNEADWQKTGISFETPLPNLKITSVFLGQAGMIWVASKDVLFSYNGKKWSNPILLPKELQSNIPLTIRKGFQDKNKNIWLVTTIGIVKFIERTQKWVIVDPFIKNDTDMKFPSVRHKVEAETSQIYEDRQGKLWFASLGLSSGIHLFYDRDKDSWGYYKLIGH
jgi:ligand-binding sensor domain-containing protein